MKAFQSKNFGQSSFLKPSQLNPSNVSTPIHDEKENNYNFPETTSNPTLRQNTRSTENAHSWETSLDKELNKILIETLNAPNKENKTNCLVDHSIRISKQAFDEQQVLELQESLINDIEEFLNLKLPMAEVENSRVGKYSLQQFLKLIETNHMLVSKINEIQKAIDIYNIKKSILIDRVLDRLQKSNIVLNKEFSDSSRSRASHDLKDLFTAKRISKQEKLDDINEYLSLCNTLQSDSESND